MERTCKNCQYFMRANWDFGEHCWGHCRKPKMKEKSIDKEDIFKWADDTCPDFVPKKEGESTDHSDDRSP